MLNLNEYEKAYTHAGTFHADDVCSTAFLKILRPDIEVERVFAVPEDAPEKSLVYDIGLGEFDHHQKDNEIRENGVPYAAFGKLFRAYGSELGLSEKSLDAFEKEIVEPLDQADNGGVSNPLSMLIGSLNPNWDEKPTYDSNFWEAVNVSQVYLQHEIETLRSIDKARDIVLDAAEKMKNGVVVLDQYAPQDALQEVPEAKFVVYPSNRGGYNIQTVPSKENPMVGRVPFPEEWLGNPDTSLGMTFCHPGNFLASANNLEDAVNIANIAVERGKERETPQMSVTEKLKHLQTQKNAKKTVSQLPRPTAKTLEVGACNCPVV